MDPLGALMSADGQKQSAGWLRRLRELAGRLSYVIPANAGIQKINVLDTGLRRCDAAKQVPWRDEEA